MERIQTVVDGGGRRVELGYNDYSQLASVMVGPVGGQLSWLQRQFDEYGRVTNSIDHNGVTVTNSYDYLDRILERRVIGANSENQSGLETFQYTVRGLTNYTDPLGKITRFVRDELSRTLYETNANLEVLRFTYKPDDQLATLTDGKNQTTSWNYDQYGRLTNKLDAASTEIFRYQYDASGRLTNRWSVARGNTAYQYDSVGNLLSLSTQHSTNNYLYDSLNRLTNMVDGVGTNVFAWTDGSRLASEDGPWSNDTVSYTYTNRLRTNMSLLQPNASAWKQSYAYDEFGRLTNAASPAGAFTYEYAAVSAGGLPTAASLVSQLDLPNAAFQANTYDDLGRLLTTALKDVNGLVLNEHDYVYNEGHQRTKQTFKAGNFVDYTYDDIGQLKTATGKELGGLTTRLQEQFSYGYDEAWNLNKRTNNALVQTFTVNSLNELTNATRSGTLTVAGDTTATATSVTVSNLPATIYQDNTFAKDGFTLVSGNNTFTAIAQDALGHQDTNTVTVNLPATVNFNYDGNGNLTNDGRRILAYDDENQLTSVIVTNGVNDSTKSEFVYDGMMRRRIRKESVWSSGSWLQTNEVRYVYDGKLVVQERDANNVPLVSYTRGNDLSGSVEDAGGIGGLLARTDHALLKAKSIGAHAYYHADGNGNITAMVDTNGVIVAHYTYDPYGNLLAKSGVLAGANLYRFSSKEYHPNSGLVYYLYRYYDPNLQRWLNRDPIGERGGLNLYRFVGNCPVNWVDLFGLSDRCHFWDIYDEKDPNPLLARINEAANRAADERNIRERNELAALEAYLALNGLGLGLQAGLLPEATIFGPMWNAGQTAISTTALGLYYATQQAALWAAQHPVAADWLLAGTLFAVNESLDFKEPPTPATGWPDFASKMASGLNDLRKAIQDVPPSPPHVPDPASLNSPVVNKNNVPPTATPCK